MNNNNSNNNNSNTSNNDPIPDIITATEYYLDSENLKQDITNETTKTLNNENALQKEIEDKTKIYLDNENLYACAASFKPSSYWENTRVPGLNSNILTKSIDSPIDDIKIKYYITFGVDQLNKIDEIISKKTHLKGPYKPSKMLENYNDISNSFDVGIPLITPSTKKINIDINRFNKHMKEGFIPMIFILEKANNGLLFVNKNRCTIDFDVPYDKNQKPIYFLKAGSIAGGGKNPRHYSTITQRQNRYYNYT